MYDGTLLTVEVRKASSYTSNLCSYCGDTNMAWMLVTYEHAAVHRGVLLQILDYISILTPLRDQGGINSVAVVFYGKTDELDNIWMPQILPYFHFSP